MHDFLTLKQREHLIKRHKKEEGKRVGDRIKAILLADEGWTYRKISKALLLDQETIGRHISEYIKRHKIENNAGGSKDKFESKGINKEGLIAHLEENTYQDTNAIILYIDEKYGITYTKSGMASWMHKNGFSYKKPDARPAKADSVKQKEFISYYDKLKSSLDVNDIILFGDGVHPSMNTKISYGWIKTGIDKSIDNGASRTRINILGAIDLKSMDVTAENYKTINSNSVCDFLTSLKDKYTNKENIHLILDCGPYNTSKQTLQKAKDLDIKIHFLPPYSPNLNPIERLWKLTNELVRNNVVFKSAKEFRAKIMTFLKVQWDTLKLSMRCRINDNFQTLNFDKLK